METPTQYDSIDTTPNNVPHAPRGIDACSRRTALFALVAGAAATLSVPADADTRPHDPEHEPLREHVDLIEVNSFYDDNGKLMLSQYIFYDWCSSSGRYQVRDWKLMKECPNKPENIMALPLRRANGDITLRIKDGDGTLREITTRHVRHTHTQYDPELLEREFLSKDRRIGLRKKPPTRAQIEKILSDLDAKDGNP